MKILIVDDSRVAIMTFKKVYLSIAPEAEIVEALSAEDAELLLNKDRFDLASLDLNLPGKDGLELAAIIQKKSPETRIMLITANIQDAVRKRADEIGVQVIEKPMSPDEKDIFINKVTQAIQNN